ncbi:hypothetical protein VCCP104417_0802, partial [Vibrio cholerae CP1044(17)]
MVSYDLIDHEAVGDR